MMLPATRTTERLTLRPFTTDDAAFVLLLVNEPGFVRFIGDRGVKDLDSARSYLRDGPLASYRQHGFGLLLVEHDNKPIGMCGLLQRETLDAPDLGFAFLAAVAGHGFAREAARAVLTDADAQGIARLLAITAIDNDRSIRLLECVGFACAGTTSPDRDDSELLVFERHADQSR